MIYLHENNYVYIDLKPDNVLVFDNNHIKLTDFTTIYIDGYNRNIAGTMYYIAPEIIASKKITDKSDVYSFDHLITYLLNITVTNNNANCDDIELATFINKCCDNDPNNRPSFIELQNSSLFAIDNYCIGKYIFSSINSTSPILDDSLNSNLI